MKTYQVLLAGIVIVWPIRGGFAQQLLAPQIQWQRSFGGSGTETAFGAVETLDGGLLVVGYSDSATNSTKSAPNRGATDCWVIRLDANGNTLWDKTYGGSSDDKISKVIRLSDGGFVLGGYSSSDTNGASCTKTSPLYGNLDFWLVRIDADGNQVWDKSYGGSGSENIEMLRQLPGGGFILGGPSTSGISGNKTSPAYIGEDYWLVRVDESGNKLWDRSFGGTSDDSLEDIGVLSDGYLLFGRSFSEISGTKTNDQFFNGDYWLIRTDADGNEVWQRAFGGTSNDEGYNLCLTPDGGCIIGGISSSGVSGNKATSNFGGGDFWLIQLD